MCSSCCCVVATVVRKRDRFVWVTHGRHGFRGFRNHDSTFAVDFIYKYHILQRETQKIGKNLSLMYKIDFSKYIFNRLSNYFPLPSP